MFPADCKSSGYRPILIVLDPTQNHKLAEIERAFRNAGGEAHSGAEAWRHLEDTAGPTMAKFLERYVRDPLDALITQVPSALPDLIPNLFGFAIYPRGITARPRFGGVLGFMAESGAVGITVSMTADAVAFRVEDEVLEVQRSSVSVQPEAESALADDVDEGLPGQ